VALRRSSRFGFPLPTPPSSQYTARAVPLMGTAAGPWPLSANSMVNYLPVDGKLVPRSRLSSINTIRSMLTIQGLTPRRKASGDATEFWASDKTRHALVNSNGSISVASFVSAFGLGVANIVESNFLWQYAHAYMGSVDDNVLVCAPGIFSYGTLQVVYQPPGSPVRYSYLTSAPRAACVGAFDNYVVAWNIEEAGTGTDFPTRVQWCQRGDPSNWTGEGSGFEDLLEMRGDGNRVFGTQDNRLILFSTQEIWYGLPATYPAQFQFYPLDRSVGLSAAGTAADTDIGIIFLGTDLNLRVLPVGGGPSRILAPQMREAIQKIFQVTGSIANSLSWGVFDPLQRLYYLHLDPSLQGGYKSFVLNVDTGEWGRLQYPHITPRVGCSFTAPTSSAIAEVMYFGDSNGTIYSHDSTLGTELGNDVTAAWQSGPLAVDLHGAYKTVTNVHVDYRSFSTASLTVRIAQKGAPSFVGGSNTVALTPAEVGRAEAQVYAGAGLPSVYLSSSDTGYELHRLDVSMIIGGRP
jgi:hypothetical protein